MVDLNKTVKLASRKTAIIMSGLIILVLVTSFSYLAVKANCDPGIPFLKTAPEANWIRYNLRPMAGMQIGRFVRLMTEFRKDFELVSVPSKVHLHIKGFKKYHLWVNDKFLRSSAAEANWKKKDTLEISQFLQTGTNTIRVKVICKYGPPALWLYTAGLQDNLKTDTTWLASMWGGPNVPASLANNRSIHPVSLEFVRPLDGLVKKLPMLILFFAVSFAVFLLANYKQKTTAPNKYAVLKFFTFTPKSVLVICVILWTILFINNIPKIRTTAGYDTKGHMQYIQYILDHHSLPLANEDWQTYQPPLFYVASALVSALTRPFADEPYTTYLLKIIPFLCGIGQICLAYFAAGVIFANNKTRQVLSVAMAAMIPMNIYISHYVSNESLCAFLIGLSILITIIILNRKQSTLRLFCILGLITGLALLTKFTTLAILPVIFFVLLFELFSGRKFSLSKLVGYLGLMFLLMVVVAGWFYGRNWIHFEKLFIGNWDRSLGFHWWQDPGFHTYKYFCQFGKVFSLPYFAGFYSLFDSLYSTFWGDGLLSGATIYTYRAPWNYHYMSAVYLLSIPATVVIIIGLFRAIREAVFRVNKSWLLILGSLFVIAYSIIYMCLRLPYYAQAKAFYGLFVVMPISLVFAFGFDCLDRWLRDKNLFLVRATVYGWFGMLAFAIFFSFLVKPSQMQTSLLANQGKLDQAVTIYTRSLRENPNDHNAHYELASAYNRQGKVEKAIEHWTESVRLKPDWVETHTDLATLFYHQGEIDKAIAHWTKAVELKPDWAEIHNNLAWVLATVEDDNIHNPAEAVRLAERACELTGYNEAGMLDTLGVAYAAAGKFADAIKVAEKALELAEAANKETVATDIRGHLELYKNNKPYRD